MFVVLLKNNLNTTTSSHTTQQAFKYKEFYIGLSLAIASSFFNASGFILKKKGLIKLVGSTILTPNKKRAVQGGYGYLKEWLWWAGLIAMALGEICNFAAYGFVPATLVTPLGALSVLISAIMASYFLKEKLTIIGKIGCGLTAIGAVDMVIHAPKEVEINSFSELFYRLRDPEFIVFIILSAISLAILVFVLAPRFGNTNVVVYVLICSILGAYAVMSCKGLSIGIKEIFGGIATSTSYVFTGVFTFLVAIFLIIQVNYLNKSLDIFSTPIVTTVYYVLFTTLVLVASAILFKELYNIAFLDMVGLICGFVTIVLSLFLINFTNRNLPSTISNMQKDTVVPVDASSAITSDLSQLPKSKMVEEDEV